MVFAGRPKLLRVLFSYLDTLLAECKLDEVHVWDYITKESDRQEVWGMTARPGYQLLNANGSLTTRWVGAYVYYSPEPADSSTPHFRPRYEGATKESTVIVKMDDDVVYIDTARFGMFTSYVVSHPDKFLVHANIVNNGVTAVYQALHVAALRETYPELLNYPFDKKRVGYMGELYRSRNLTTALHRMFLTSPEQFAWNDTQNGNCILFGRDDNPGQGRISINFFGARWAMWKPMAKLADGKITDDEQLLTTVATAFGLRECIFTPFNVVHLNFRGCSQANMLHDYERLALARATSTPFAYTPPPPASYPVLRQPLEVQRKERSLNVLDFLKKWASDLGPAAINGSVEITKPPRTAGSNADSNWGTDTNRKMEFNTVVNGSRRHGFGMLSGANRADGDGKVEHALHGAFDTSPEKGSVSYLGASVVGPDGQEHAFSTKASDGGVDVVRLRLPPHSTMQDISKRAEWPTQQALERYVDK